MLIRFANLCNFSRSSSSSKTLISLPKPSTSPFLFPKRFSKYRFETFPKRFVSLCFQNYLMSSSSSKIVAEYAKSSRSSCKKCAKSIPMNALRLGLVSRDSRGFDLTKWHHLECFPVGSADPVASAEAIKGFGSLKSNDQEELKKLVVKGVQSVDEVLEGGEDAIEGSLGKSSKQLRVSEDEQSEAGCPKKPKLFAPDEELQLEIPLSVSDIKTKYKDATLLPRWKAFQTVIFLERDDGLNDSRKIAAFDFDGCLAKTSVKRVGADAWSLMYPSIPDKLLSLYNDGYKLVIFTNESNIERWKKKRQVAVDSKIGRLENFIKHVKVPIQVFIACGLGKSDGQEEDRFRKPKTGMWHIVEQHFNSGLSIDMDQSFYVGDAAGRPDDHSDTDSKFAQALGLKFYVPEEYFET